MDLELQARIEGTKVKEITAHAVLKAKSDIALAWPKWADPNPRDLELHVWI